MTTQATTIPIYPIEVFAISQDLYIGESNSKTGPAFSLPEGSSCPGKTDLCSRLCYGKTGRMKMSGPAGKRGRNFQAVAKLLKVGGADLLASSSAMQIATSKAVKTKSFRIHDLGDFFSPEYIKAWIQVVQQFPDVKFWAYTRSWRIHSLLTELKVLAKLPNMALWISTDAECWMSGMNLAADCQEFAGSAFMQTDETEEIARQIQSKLGKERFINFPAHGNFGRILTTTNQELRNCPAVTKQIPVSKKNPACLVCKLCLPN